jgi:hypothetical protein
MVGTDDRPLWLRPHSLEQATEVERRRTEHVFTTLGTASDREQEYSKGLLYGIVAGIVTGAVLTLIVIWCVALVYLA